MATTCGVGRWAEGLSDIRPTYPANRQCDVAEPSHRVSDGKRGNDAPQCLIGCCVFAEAFRVIPKWYHGVMALTVRTDAALEEALASLSRDEGISRQEIIRRAVLERYERSGHVARVTDATGRMVLRWADVLERLGAE